MKKIIIILLLMMILYILTNVSVGMSTIKVEAAELYPSGDYLEKNQWGALEDVLKDWKSQKITTDECALYGCYILVANDSKRTDKDDKAKLLPTKYKLNKKSEEAGPYFFINYLYQFENLFGEKALEEFRNSEWSDYEYISDFTLNNRFSNLIINTPLEKGYHEEVIRHSCAIIFKAIEDKIIKPETFEFKYMMAKIGMRRYYEKIKPFCVKNNFGCKEDCTYHYYEIWDKHPEIFENRKLANVLNYHHWYQDIYMMRFVNGAKGKIRIYDFGN